MIRRVVFAILVLALAAGAALVAGCGGGGSVSGSDVAKVGNASVTQDAFNEKVKEFAAQYGITESADPEQWKQFQSEVLEYMITYQLAAQKAASFGVSVTDAEVQAEIDKIISDPNYYNGDKAAFQKDLEAAGMTEEKLKASYKESMLIQKVYDKVTESIKTVPDSEIQAYYDANKAQYYVEETRAARHILIAPDGKATNEGTTTTTTAPGSSSSSTSSSTTTTSLPTDADWAQALQTAQEVRALLVAGGDWKQLAAKYSDDPGTKDNGGDLGQVPKGQMVKEFEESVFSLKQNEISQPVKSTYGYHIIEVTSITPAKQKTLDEVKDTINTTLVSQKKKAEWTKWIADTKAAIGVQYGEAWQTTTTSAGSQSTTTGPTAGSTESTTPTTGGSSTTTGPETTTTTAGQSITTSGAATTTTAGETLPTIGTSTTAP